MIQKYTEYKKDFGHFGTREVGYIEHQKLSTKQFILFSHLKIDAMPKQLLLLFIEVQLNLVFHSGFVLKICS